LEKESNPGFGRKVSAAYVAEDYPQELGEASGMLPEPLLKI